MWLRGSSTHKYTWQSLWHMHNTRIFEKYLPSYYIPSLAVEKKINRTVLIYLPPMASHLRQFSIDVNVQVQQALFTSQRKMYDSGKCYGTLGYAFCN